MRTKKHVTRWSLSLFVSLVAAGAVTLGMTLYAIVQYSLNPEISPLALALHHGWHVIALWLLTYLCVLYAMHWLVLRPIHKIYVHLYGIGAGRVQPLALRTSVRELDEIIEGVNLMIHRMMDVGPEGEARTHVHEVARTLRTVAHERATRDPQLAHRLTHAAKDLDQALTGLRVTI